eukprot:Clim_evm33s232 gene=Clim_evmTU33s232
MGDLLLWFLTLLVKLTVFCTRNAFDAYESIIGLFATETQMYAFYPNDLIHRTWHRMKVICLRDDEINKTEPIIQPGGIAVRDPMKGVVPADPQTKTSGDLLQIYIIMVWIFVLSCLKAGLFETVDITRKILLLDDIFQNSPPPRSRNSSHIQPHLKTE